MNSNAPVPPLRVMTVMMNGGNVTLEQNGAWHRSHLHSWWPCLTPCQKICAAVLKRRLDWHPGQKHPPPPPPIAPCKVYSGSCTKWFQTCINHGVNMHLHCRRYTKDEHHKQNVTEAGIRCWKDRWKGRRRQRPVDSEMSLCLRSLWSCLLLCMETPIGIVIQHVSVQWSWNMDGRAGDKSMFIHVVTFDVVSNVCELHVVTCVKCRPPPTPPPPVMSTFTVFSDAVWNNVLDKNKQNSFGVLPLSLPSIHPLAAVCSMWALTSEGFGLALCVIFY